MLNVKKASPSDLERIMEIYAYAQEYMIKTGNPTQWGHFYPTRDMVINDIEIGTCHVICDDDGIHGVFALFEDADPTYDYIEGNWLNDDPYITIHRIAGDGQTCGIFKRAADYCKSICDNVRIDTHADNKTMQHLIEKNGFDKCGIIYVSDGSPRLAYQWTRQPTLYMMRHGRTDWNNNRKLQGRTDIPLNEEGRQMAIEAREIYKNVNIDICYCSPLSRARETAELFLDGRDIPVICDDRLVEMSFGIYEGTSVDFNDDDSPKNLFFNHPEQYEGAEGGETFEELFARAEDFLEKVAYPLLDEGKSVLIIGHGAMNASLYCLANNLPLSQFWSSGRKNCELIKLKTTTNNIHPLK